jgi:hypothetical protein
MHFLSFFLHQSLHLLLLFDLLPLRPFLRLPRPSLFLLYLIPAPSKQFLLVLPVLSLVDQTCRPPFLHLLLEHLTHIPLLSYSKLLLQTHGLFVLFVVVLSQTTPI